MACSWFEFLEKCRVHEFSMQKVLCLSNTLAVCVFTVCFLVLKGNKNGKNKNNEEHRLFGILLVTLTVFAAAEEEFQLENIKDEAGKLLTLNITHKEAEEDIDVLNDKGESVIKVEIHEHEGYQIDKPANDSVCLLSGNDENENETFCYNRIEYPDKNVTSALQEHCEGRDIFVLVPTDCAQPDEIGGSNTDMMSGEGRVKRSWRCYTCSYYTLRCVRVTRCCRWNLIFCTRRCFVRNKCRLVKVTYYTCSYYWKR